ncbi:MAG: hypothetical protein HOP07_18720 [Bacteriovoracaceae bacterium]|nr:hypothetical protein [Bacteriovoracaceae bacterium]
MYWETVNRNEEFLKNNPNFINENPPPSHMIEYVLGIVFMLIIGIGVYIKSTLLLQVIHYSSVIVFIWQASLRNHLSLKKIKKKIPTASKRSTQLVARNIYDYISKKKLSIFGIFLFIAFFGILFGLLSHTISLSLFITRIALTIVLILFLIFCTLVGMRTSAFTTSKWAKNEKITRAGFSVIFIVSTLVLLDLYIRLMGIFFEMPNFINASIHEYLMGFASLSAFMYFVLNMKLDIPDWYEKTSLKI